VKESVSYDHLKESRRLVRVDSVERMLLTPEHHFKTSWKVADGLR